MKLMMGTPEIVMLFGLAGRTANKSRRYHYFTDVDHVRDVDRVRRRLLCRDHHLVVWVRLVDRRREGQAEGTLRARAHFPRGCGPSMRHNGDGDEAMGAGPAPRLLGTL